MEYNDWAFQASIILNSKVLTRNYMVLSLVISFVSCFSIAATEVSYSPTVKFTPRSRIRLVIIIALIDFFNTLTSWGCFFLSNIFLGSLASASDIAASWKEFEVRVGTEIGANIEISLTGSHLPNRKFFGMV